MLSSTEKWAKCVALNARYKWLAVCVCSFVAEISSISIEITGLPGERDGNCEKVVHVDLWVMDLELSCFHICFPAARFFFSS